MLDGIRSIGLWRESCLCIYILERSGGLYFPVVVTVRLCRARESILDDVGLLM